MSGRMELTRDALAARVEALTAERNRWRSANDTFVSMVSRFLGRDIESVDHACTELEKQRRDLTVALYREGSSLIRAVEAEARVETLTAALIDCAEAAGEDGIDAVRCGAMIYPSVEKFAVDAVRQLRADYDADGEDWARVVTLENALRESENANEQAILLLDRVISDGDGQVKVLLAVLRNAVNRARAALGAQEK